MARQIDTIIIHHSAGSGGSLEEIRRIPVEDNGWSDIGYHAIITNGCDIGGRLSEDAPLGMLFWGRPEYIVGAHCRNNNVGSLGVCVIGNFDTMPVPPEQEHTLVLLLKDWCDRYGVLKDRAEIIGHREAPGHHSNACPGQNLFVRLPHIIKAVRNLT